MAMKQIEPAKKNIYLDIDREIITTLARILDSQEKTIEFLLKLHERMAVLEKKVIENAKRRSK